MICERCKKPAPMDPAMGRVPLTFICPGCERECCEACGEHDAEVVGDPPSWSSTSVCMDCVKEAS